MKKNLLLSLVVLFSALFSTNSSFAQCTGNTSSFGSLSSSNVLNAVQSISICNYTTEYSTVSNLLVGGVYEFGLSSTPGYVTVMTGPGGTGTVIAHGAPPLVFVATAATLYPHWNDNAACATSTSCYATTLTYTAPPASCIQPIALNAANITTTTALLSWNDANTTPAANYDVYHGLAFSPPPNAATVPTATSTMDTLTLGGLTPATDYDYYVRGRCSATDTSAWAGPFTFTTLATCVAPSALTATNITSNSVDLGWTENNSATQWDIELGLQSFTPTGNATPGFGNITTNPFVLPGGLPPNTCFDFYVRSQCAPGDTSTWTGPYTFCTLVDVLNCPPGANPSVIWQESFTNSFTGQTNLPNAAAPGWTANFIAGNPTWALESNNTGSGSTGPNFGAQGSTGYAYLEVSCVSGGNDTMISPSIDLTNVAGAARVKWFNHMYGPNSGKLDVFVDNGTSLTSIYSDSGQTQASSAAAWDSVVIGLNSFVGQTITLKFVGTAANPGGCSGDRGIDEISVEACISCPAPSNISAANITGTTCDLSWVENGSATAWELEVIPAGTTPTGVADSVGVTVNTNKNITGLTQFQPVDFYVRSVCGSGDTSSWAGPFTVLPCAPLAGTYTVDPALPLSATNFNTMNEVATALQCGISAPVIFDMAAGNSFSEQVIFDEVSGASATNTITFNGNGDTVTHAATVSADRHTIRLNGADYFRFNDLVVEATGGSFGFAMHLFNGGTNGTDSNLFTNCTFQVPTTATSTAICPFAVSGSLTSPTTACVAKTNGNIVDSCVARGGYYCMTNYGSFTAANYGAGNQIKNTEVVDFYAYGIYFLYQDDYLVSGNNIHRDVRTNSTTCYGVYGSGITSNVVVEKNWVHNPFPFTSTSTFYGLEFFNDASGVATSTVVKNNLVEDVVSNGTQYGIYFSFANNIKVYHNTVVLDDIASTGTGATRGIFQNGTTSPGQDIQNNNIYITRGGTGTKHGIYKQASSGTYDYNNVYITSTAGSNNYGYNGANRATLAAWQTSAGTPGTNSSDIDPIFANTAPDFTPSNPLMNGTGNALGVLEDHISSPRSATNPDMGAFEFAVSATDMAVNSILQPNPATGCYTAMDTVIVEMTNAGSAAINFATNPMTVTAQVSGTITATLTATINTGTLAPFGTLPVTLSPSINMTANGAYTIDVYSSTVGDPIVVNDTLAPVVYNVNLMAGTATADPDILCLSGTSVLTLTGNAGGNIQWQEATASTGPWTDIAGATSTTYTTGTLTADMYYRAVLSCNSSADTTNVDTVIVSNPSIASTLNDTVCGPNSATLMATMTPGSASFIQWFDAAVGGNKVDTGSMLATPVLTATDTFYAAAIAGGGSDTAGISAWNYNYSGASRGGWFVAQSDYDITELQVPLEASASPGGLFQSIVILKMNASTIPPSGTGYTILYQTMNNPITGYIPVNIPIATGDVIVMIGNRSTSATATTGNIAYSNSASSVTVDGFTTTYNRTTLGHVNANNAGFTQSISGSNGSVAGMVRFNWSTGCEGPRSAVYAVVNPSGGNMALTTTSNANSNAGGTDSLNDMQADGQTLSYYNPTCELIATVDDALGGNVLGMVTSKVNVEPTVQLHNGEPFARRWYQISPASNGPADVTLYYTQGDFDDYNASAPVVGGMHDSLPTGPADATGIARLRIAKNDSLGLGSNPIDLTPNAVVWNATDSRWEVNISVASFSQFRAHAVNPLNTPLPVALTKFDVTKEGSVSLAAWITASEQFNSHFNLQRSLDGNTFTTLGRVNTKAVNGNSTSELNYNFTDNAPQIGHNYYRLEQVDQDGNMSYSQIVDLVWGADGSVVSIYPNPATDKLNVDVSIDKVAQMEVRLLDMSGRVVKSVMQQTQKGMNNVTLSLSDIAIGVYGVQIFENNQLIHSSKVNKRTK